MFFIELQFTFGVVTKGGSLFLELYGIPFFFLAVLTWPAGTYGLPKAKNGCPVSPKTNWITGWRFEDTEDSRPNNKKSPSFHLDTLVGKDINRTFCIKDKNKETTEWPQGKQQSFNSKKRISSFGSCDNNKLCPC